MNDSNPAHSIHPGRRNAESPPPPAVPLTLDGSALLHQMFRVRWAAWKTLDTTRRREVVDEASSVLAEMENHEEGGSAVFSELGHKGDLMIIHFRRTFDGVNQAELRLSQLQLADYLEPTTSYVSVVELGLYESSVQLYKSLVERGIQPGTEDWIKAEQDKMEESRQAMADRLWPAVPEKRYLCFYPMDKKRGEVHNWYNVEIADRRRMMRDHGMIGRRYAGKVKQIISGSIGFDDWEWGVDLFADDPLVFKKLIYEMRFDEASALYALFGTFYLGLRFSADQLGVFFDGTLPNFDSSQLSHRT